MLILYIIADSIYIFIYSISDLIDLWPREYPLRSSLVQLALQQVGWFVARYYCGQYYQIIRIGYLQFGFQERWTIHPRLNESFLSLYSILFYSILFYSILSSILTVYLTLFLSLFIVYQISFVESGVAHLLVELYKVEEKEDENSSAPGKRRPSKAPKPKGKQQQQQYPFSRMLSFFRCFDKYI